MDKNIHTMTDFSWLKLLICSLALLNTRVHASSKPVHITFLESAKEKGAVCLDGSPPAYYYDEGSGEGANNWMVLLEGGGWCGSDVGCHDDVNRWNCNKDGCANSYERNNTITFSGMLSGSQTINPDFYNWNRVHVVYCDGSLFAGDIEEVAPKYKIYRRGARIFKAVIDNLLDKGMKNANNAILTGYSAGGLATILNCDYFRKFVPNTERVKCIADSAFFIHAKDLPGATDIREKHFNAAVAYHGLEKILPNSCTSKMPPGLCLFPENLVGDIQTPLFLVDSTFDTFQLLSQMEFLGGNWSKCVSQDPELCISNHTLLQRVKDFRTAFLKALPKCASIGMFIDTCSVHGHCVDDKKWTHYTLKNKTLVEAVGDWYFDRSSFCEIDTEHDFIQKCS